VDSAGPSTEALHEMTGDLEDLSLPEDTSYDSSSASVTPSLAPGTIRSPLDLPYFRNTLAPLLVVPGTENPLVDLVLPLSDRSETLLNAICLVAKAHQAQGDPTATPSRYLDLYQLVLRGLRSSVADAHASDPDLHLATNVLLSYYEVGGIQTLEDLEH
jgi:Fungal specific transcription factor domain